jgi:hypothetical protein
MRWCASGWIPAAMARALVAALRAAFGYRDSLTELQGILCAV